MSEPNYSKCSLKDLHSVTKHIDQDLYPERYARTLEEIERRRSEGDHAQQSLDHDSDPAAEKRANRIFWGLLVSLIAIGVIAVGWTSAKRNQEMQVAMAKSQRGIEPVRDAMEADFTDQEIQAKLDRSGSKISIHLTVTNAELADSSEEELAESLAVAAYKAFSKPRKVGSVQVTFARETKGFLSTKSELGDAHEFSSEDLLKLME